MNPREERQAIREARMAADALDSLGPDWPEWVWAGIIIGTHLLAALVGGAIGWLLA
jgi:hypothetical protein